jgi:hypothetical protein
VQLALEGAWATLQALQHRKAEDDSLPRLPPALRTALWQERQQQHHFVNNMVLYLSMDVVDASFGQLRASIAAARDFSAADAAHRQYVDSLVSQAFLDMKQLMAHLEGILRQCRELCTLIQVCLRCLALESLAGLQAARCSHLIAFAKSALL